MTKSKGKLSLPVLLPLAEGGSAPIRSKSTYKAGLSISPGTAAQTPDTVLKYPADMPFSQNHL